MRTRPLILILSEKWCDANPACGLSTSEDLFYPTLEKSNLADHIGLHFDELLAQGHNPDEVLLQTCREKKPDYLFIVYYALPGCPYNPSLQCLKTIRFELDIPIIGTWWDTIDTDLSMMDEVAPFVDFNIAMDSSWRYPNFTRYPGKCLGSLFTPYDTTLFCDPHLPRDIPVSFVGWKKNSRQREETLDYLLARQVPILVTGGQRDNKLPVEQYANILQRSLISLNISFNNNGHLQAKGRSFEVTLCGALLMENTNFETERFFSPDRDYVTFDNKIDLLDKVRYYLSHTDELKTIALQGHQTAMNHYTGFHFWQYILDKFNSIKLFAPSSPTNPYLKAAAHAYPVSIPAEEENGDIAALFEAGNYSTVAQTGSENDWRKYAALGILGFKHKALAGLSRFKGDHIRFYVAVTCWIAGDEANAIQIVENLSTAEAASLLRLIRKPKINVLTQIEQREWLAHYAYHPRFNVRNLGPAGEDIPVSPFGSIHDFSDPSFSPDFYICRMLEWQMVPIDIGELQCPIFAHTADYDVHIQSIHPWLSQFDELIVAEETHWQELSRMTGKNVVNIFKAYSIKVPQESVPEGARKIDLFISGTLFHPFHPDKALLINHLLDMPDVNVVVMDGFIGKDTYDVMLGNSKICLSHMRYPRGTQTRALESLGMGTAVIVHHENILNLLGGKEEGIFNYDMEGYRWRTIIRHIIDDWDRAATSALKGAEVIREEFSVSAVADYYLRFLTFLAAKPRERRTPSAASLSHKRSVLWKGRNETPAANRTMREKTASHCLLELERNPAPRQVIDIAREHLLEYASWTYLPAARDSFIRHPDAQKPDHRQLSAVLSIYRHGIERFPDSLVLRFNMIRAALHFGDSDETAEGLALARRSLEFPADHWQVDPLEDVFPWDFFPQMFNYRRYLDAVTGILQGRENLSDLLREIILASLNYYEAQYSRRSDRLATAYQLDPDFPFYALAHAKRLAQGEGAAKDQAVAILTELAETSMVFRQAFAELERTLATDQEKPASFERLWRKMSNAEDRIFKQKLQIDDWDDTWLQTAGNEQPEQAAQEVTVSIAGQAHEAPPSSKQRILYLPLEHVTWHKARGWSYLANFGLEEGFTANEVEFLTVPALAGISTKFPCSWLHHLKELCAGQIFDQVWVELVHSDPGEELLSWISTVAPVRLAMIPESITHEQEDFAVNPDLIWYRTLVESRLKYMTHALVVDEKSATELNERGTVRAMHWIPSIPTRFISGDTPQIESKWAIFSGNVYGPRKNWLAHQDLANLLRRQTGPDVNDRYSCLFDQINAAALVFLSNRDGADPKLLDIWLQPIRLLRQRNLVQWMAQFRRSHSIVNLPGRAKSYSWKVLAAMAAGRPVISWELPDRPQTRALFRDGEEILLFPKDRPDLLAHQIQRLQNDPELEVSLATNGWRTVLAHHTAEQRVAQILHWVATGETAGHENPCHDTNVSPVAADFPWDTMVDRSIDSFNNTFGSSIAVDAVRSAYPVNPGSVDKKTTTQLAKELNLALTNGDAPAAGKMLRVLSSADPTFVHYLSHFFVTMGDLEAATPMSLLTLSLNCNNPEVLIDAAIVAKKRGWQKSARLFIKEALLSNPSKEKVMDLFDLYHQLSVNEQSPERFV